MASSIRTIAAVALASATLGCSTIAPYERPASPRSPDDFDCRLRGRLAAADWGIGYTLIGVGFWYALLTGYTGSALSNEARLATAGVMVGSGFVVAASGVSGIKQRQRCEADRAAFLAAHPPH